MSPSGNLSKNWVNWLRKIGQVVILEIISIIKIMFISYSSLEEYYKLKWKACKTLGQLLGEQKMGPNGELGNSLVGYRYINIKV